MKKLLQINPVIRTSTSTGKIMRTLGELAINAGWESWIAYSRARDGVPTHSSSLIPVGNKLDLAFHWIATRIFDAHGLVSRLATKKLIAQIRAIDPDIVHIHNVHGYFLNYPMLCRFLAERGKPVIWTAHDCWLFTGHCYHYAAAGCDRWRTGCHDCPQKHSFPASYGFDRSKKNYRDKKAALTAIPNLTIVAVSQWMQHQIAQSFLRDIPCRVISNGIDLSTFQPRPDEEILSRYGIPKSGFYLAIAAIWLPEKGLADLAALARQLRDDEQLVVVGQMTDTQRKTLPESFIHITRTEDARALATLYTEASALVNPTWQDNYPTVNLEAQACGTPVVTYRTGGSPETLSSQTGLVVEQGDVKGLLKALHHIKETGPQAWQNACRKHAEAHFGKDARFHDYLSLYEDLATR